MQAVLGPADDAAVHPAVAGLCLEEKGFVLGATLARLPPAEVSRHLPGPGDARCAAAVAALAQETRPARAAAIAALAAVVRAPVPAGIERCHPDWLRERFERAASDVVAAVSAGLPAAARRVADEVLRARGAYGRTGAPELRAQGLAALQRIVFAGLVPLAGPGGPATPVARELAALDPPDLERAIEVRGAEMLGQSLRGAPPRVVAQAAAALGEPLAARVLEAARGEVDAAAREQARERVAAAGSAAAGQAALDIGIQALVPLLLDEGAAAVSAVAQRLPEALGRRLLAAAKSG